MKLLLAVLAVVLTACSQPSQVSIPVAASASSQPSVVVPLLDGQIASAKEPGLIDIEKEGISRDPSDRPHILGNSFSSASLRGEPEGVAVFCGTYDSPSRNVKGRFRAHCELTTASIKVGAKGTCSVSFGTWSRDFDKVDGNTWKATYSTMCGGTEVMTLMRQPGLQEGETFPGAGRFHYPWNYKSVASYPMSAKTVEPTAVCAPLAGKTEVEEYLTENHHVRDLGCRYFDL